MPCALTSSDNYPDYLKQYLNEIAAGDNKELKACACPLKTPTTDEECPILDEDGKVGAFPFCIPLVEDGFGLDTFYPLKLTLKEAMAFYWLTKNSSASAKILTGYHDPWNSCPRDPYPPIRCLTGSKIYLETISSLNFTFNGLTNKDKVCPGHFNVGANVSSVNIARSCPFCSTSCDLSPSSLIEIGIVSAFESPFISYDEENDIVTYGPRMVMNKEGEDYYFYPYFNLVYISYGGGIATKLSQIEGSLPCYCGCVTETKKLSIDFPGFTKDLNYYFRTYSSYNPKLCYGFISDYECGNVVRTCVMEEELKLNFF